MPHPHPTLKGEGILKESSLKEEGVEYSNYLSF